MHAPPIGGGTASQMTGQSCTEGASDYLGTATQSSMSLLMFNFLVYIFIIHIHIEAFLLSSLMP